MSCFLGLTQKLKKMFGTFRI